MITGLSHVTVYSTDQNRSLEFYTNVLGLELRSDVSLDGFRA